MLNKLTLFFGHDLARLRLYQDFTERYQQDPALLSGEEIVQRYGALAEHLEEQDMDGAHQIAFAKLSEQDRRELAQQYQYASRDPTRPFQGYRGGTHFTQMMQPRWLGRMTKYAAQNDPELVTELIGSESPINSAEVRLAIAGAAVSLVSNYLSRQ